MDETARNGNVQMGLVNIVENMVRVRVDELIVSMDMCDCDKCRHDACAIALNHLPPQYVTSNMGVLFGKLADIKASCLAAMTVEVTKALIAVKERPMHG